MQSPAFGVIPNKRHRLEPLRFQQARQRVLAQGDDAESDAGEQGEGGAVSQTDVLVIMTLLLSQRH